MIRSCGELSMEVKAACSHTRSLPPSLARISVTEVYHCTMLVRAALRVMVKNRGWGRTLSVLITKKEGVLAGSV